MKIINAPACCSNINNKEPDSQIEVAIAAIKCAVDDDSTGGK